LANPKKILAVVKNELIELKEKYGDERKPRSSEPVLKNSNRKT